MGEPEDADPPKVCRVSRARAVVGSVVQIFERDEPSLNPYSVREPREQEALDIVCDVLQVACRPAHEPGRERRALPQVLLAHLGDRGAEAAVERGAYRQQLLALGGES
jgi:hypothetical protein